MAFYDEIRKKFNQTKETVIQKTSNYTELSRLDASTAQLEKEISSIYAEIGKLYYEKYASDMQNADPDLLPSFSRISEVLAQIGANRETARNIKGLKLCPECGEEIAVDAAFCNHCGAKQLLKPVFPQDGVLCPVCGEFCKAGQLFCMSCGTRLRICRNCGTVLDEGTIYCMTCGTKWEDKAPMGAEMPAEKQAGYPEEPQADMQTAWAGNSVLRNAAPFADYQPGAGASPFADDQPAAEAAPFAEHHPAAAAPSFAYDQPAVETAPCAEHQPAAPSFADHQPAAAPQDTGYLYEPESVKPAAVKELPPQAEPDAPAEEPSADETPQ